MLGRTQVIVVVVVVLVMVMVVVIIIMAAVIQGLVDIVLWIGQGKAA